MELTQPITSPIPMQRKPILIAHTAGPGDVITTYRHWLKGEADPHEVSETYSGQFYGRIKARSLSACVIGSHPRQEVLRDAWITLEHRPRHSKGKSGLAFHLAELWYWLRVISTFIRARAAIAVIGDMEHWWLLTLLRLAGIEVITVLHCTFWPKGHRSSRFSRRVVGALNGWFWRHVPVATISISPECERQVRELAGERVAGALLQARPLYHSGYLDAIPAPHWEQQPFRVLFAGRMERDKGIFDLLDLAERLRDFTHHEVVFEVCGSGSAQDEFAEAIERRRLEDQVRFIGRLDRHGMKDAFNRAHITFVPTTATFPEGLNQVVVESVLAGRPVIATEICPAIEVVPNAVISIAAGDIDAMAEAIRRLATDRMFYEQLQRNCKDDALPFYDIGMSWGAALDQAIEIALGQAGFDDAG
jgi:glycosyltransferase involved in cell wall biosynthesis